MRYALLLHNHEPAPGEVAEETIEEMQQLFDAYGKALEAAGVLVGGNILHPSRVATTITRRSGTTQVQDGPFAETKEALAGVFVIEVPDADAVLAWAEKCPGATYGSVEVRPVAVSLTAGAWTAHSPA